MPDYIQISIETNERAASELLVALLSESGFEGFEETDTHLHAFIPAKDFDEEEIRRLMKIVPFDFSRKIIRDQNWNESWEKNFEPVRINDFCGIRASFHDPMENLQHEIIITPKMSFGTGHHATTRLMIEAMSKLNFISKTVLDFGTGTGLLAILAEQLGAQEVIAIDYDDRSIENARENIEANHCLHIELKKQDHAGFAGMFDIILANINKNVIINNLHFLSQHLSKQGVLLLSGLLTEDLEEIKIALSTHHFSISYYRQSDNWLCLQCSLAG